MLGRTLVGAAAKGTIFIYFPRSWCQNSQSFLREADKAPEEASSGHSGGGKQPFTIQKRNTLDKYLYNYIYTYMPDSFELDQQTWRVHAVS